MAKRFTDTDKWKKRFIRGLETPYKVFWLYLLDECDHAGMWNVDIDVANLKMGENIDLLKALDVFKDKVLSFDDGNKWFIQDFIEFQYGDLNPTNRVHNSVITLLNKYKINYKNKPLISPLQGVKDKDKDKDMEKYKEGVEGETIKIDLIKNEKMPIGWANTVSEFLNDYEFKKSCCQFYSAEWSEVEDRMVKFIQGVHLKQQFQDIAALKTHFRNHYKKHYINGGSSVKEIKEKNQGALSNGFIEAPKNFDYDKMGKW